MKKSKLPSFDLTSPLKRLLKKPPAKISEKVGLPPGTIMYTGHPKEGPTNLSLMRYNSTDVQEQKPFQLSELEKKKPGWDVEWVNVDSLHDVEIISKIGSLMGIHVLTLEDIVHVSQAPKMEEYEEYLYVTMKMIKPVKEGDTFRVEHISFVLMPGLLISFQEDDDDPFDTIRERIRTGKGKARGRGPDYLLFLLIDAIVDQYLLSIESLDKHIENLELEIFEQRDEKVVNKIIEQKKVLAELRKIILPVRDSLKEITTGESSFINEKYFNYFNDVYDHIKGIVEHLDNQREMLTSLMELYMSQISTHMNKVMQTLTIVATIFIPLTFLAGIYGMNFQNMPELAWKWSYPILMGTMVIIGVGMYVYMRKRRWF